MTLAEFVACTSPAWMALLVALVPVFIGVFVDRHSEIVSESYRRSQIGPNLRSDIAKTLASFAKGIGLVSAFITTTVAYFIGLISIASQFDPHIALTMLAATLGLGFLIFFTHLFLNFDLDQIDSAHVRNPIYRLSKKSARPNLDPVLRTTMYGLASAILILSNLIIILYASILLLFP